jgi:hypothetical protein
VGGVAVGQRAGAAVVDAVAGGEVLAALPLHLEDVVEPGHHRAGAAEVGVGQRPGREQVDLALCLGLRGLPGGDTLRRLLRRSGRKVPERRGQPRKEQAAVLPPAQEKPARRMPPRPRGG